MPATATKKNHTVAVICGSVRDRSMTNAAMQILLDELSILGLTATVIDPVGIPLPHLGAPFGEPHASAMKQRVGDADGVILCTPEYNGSFSSVMMAIIENLGYPVVFAGKPVALLGVAAGRIGAVKALEHLRSVCAHSGALVLPFALSIAEAHRQFDAQGVCQDARVEDGIRTVARSMARFLREGRI